MLSDPPPCPPPTTAFIHCAVPFPAGVTNLTLDETNQRIIGVTGPEGKLVLPVKMAGSTGPRFQLSVYADGVPIGNPLLLSPDQNADLVVDAADEAILVDKLANPTQDNIATGDLNGDGVLGDGDIAVLESHRNHVCDVSTPVRRGNWGKLKLLYR